MTALVTRFAIVGRQFPIEAFVDLHRAGETARVGHKRPPASGLRRWRGRADAVVLPKQLSA